MRLVVWCIVRQRTLLGGFQRGVYGLDTFVGTKGREKKKHTNKRDLGLLWELVGIPWVGKGEGRGEAKQTAAAPFFAVHLCTTFFASQLVYIAANIRGTVI